MIVVLVTLLATLFIQCGYFLWKLSADGQPRIGSASFVTVFRALVCDWRWVLGFFCTVAGWILFVQATALGDISLIQPLMSSGDIFLILLAVIFLRERLNFVESIGIFLTVLGAVLLALEAEESHPGVEHGLTLLLLLGCLALIAAGLLATVRKSSRPEVHLAMAVGLFFGVGATLTEAMTASSAASGPAKISWSILLEPLLLGVVIANMIGLVLLQAAFQRGRAAVVVPLQLAIANAVAVLAGIIVFGEQITFLRGAGIGLIVAGTGLIQVKRSSTGGESGGGKRSSAPASPATLDP